MITSKGTLWGFAVGAGVGGAGCYLYLQREGQLPRPCTTTIKGLTHEALKYGMPVTEDIKVHDGFVTAFDFRTRNPKWVLESITPESLVGNADRQQSHFHEDPAIEVWLRSRLQDFKDSGYDRGHLAPAADFKSSQAAMNQSFMLTNISPQIGAGFNRDYWARFEQFVRGVAKRSEEVRVCTGPLWLPSVEHDGKWSMRHKMIGQPPSLVSVPTHFYKVITAKGCGKDGHIGVAAFVMPNSAIEPKTPLSAFCVPLEALESVSGTRFFPGLLSNNRRRVLDDAALGWRTAGLQQMSPFERHTFQVQTLALPVQVPAGQAPARLSASATAKQQARDAVRAPSGAPSSPASQAQIVQVAGQQSSPAKQEAAASPFTVPLTKPGYGVVHLCEVEACRLPVERFWANNARDSSNAGHKHTGSSGAKAVVVRAGPAEPFNERAASVKRLISRDRKEFLGNDDDILDQYTTEFGEGARDQDRAPQADNPAGAGRTMPTSPSASAATPAAAAAAAAPPKPLPPTKAPPPPVAPQAANPFKASRENPFGPDNPFGPSSTSSPFGAVGQTKSKIEPEGLRPDMGPDYMEKETPLNLLQNITLTQVVIVLSFTTVIGIMIATFFLVLKTGAIRLNGLD